MFREAQLLSCCKAFWDKMGTDVFGGENKELETCFNFKVCKKKVKGEKQCPLVFGCEENRQGYWCGIKTIKAIDR